ncbi:hypothetical protein JMJ35_007678 [Cladonia borealis]|uniref:G domain-containing protein n=1 Tax=Cladonia borealis TaxID=184061 RepID=A0AA39V3S1_9LECA|nr:hypothetical protein JMJ35_007678 [Cladonia borealis]
MLGSLQDVYVAVMGVTGAGKSTFIEKLTGEEVNVNHGLVSCTADVEEYTFVYKARYKVHLIDTPGFNDTTLQDIDVLRKISSWLSAAYANDIKLSGIIYLHKITDNKMTGSAQKNLWMFKKLCGQDCFHKVCLVTTMWENVDEGTGNMREKELIETEAFWGYMKQHGSQVRQHTTNTRESAMSILGTLIEKKSDIVLDIQKELKDGMRLDNTGAGRQLTKAIDEIREKYRQDLEKLKKEKQDADAESAEQIEELQRQRRQELEQINQERKKMEVDMARLLEQKAQDLKSMENDTARQLKELEQELHKLEERNARYGQKLQEKREQLKEMKKKGEGNQALVLREIETMEETSKTQDKEAEEKRNRFERALKWVKQHREGLTESALLVAQIAGTMKCMKAAK